MIQAGLEPATARLEGVCSIRLSHRIKEGKITSGLIILTEETIERGQLG